MRALRYSRRLCILNASPDEIQARNSRQNRMRVRARPMHILFLRVMTMKNGITSIGLWLCIVLSSCITTLTDTGKAVQIVTNFTASDATLYEEIGPVEYTETGWIDPKVVSNAREELTERCRSGLRNSAGAMGADIVLLERSEPADCQELFKLEVVHPGECLKMIGRAYKTRQPAASPSGAAPSGQ